MLLYTCILGHNQYKSAFLVLLMSLRGEVGPEIHCSYPRGPPISRLIYHPEPLDYGISIAESLTSRQGCTVRESWGGVLAVTGMENLLA